MLKSPLEPALLTHAAEIAGQHLPSATVVPVLLDLLNHPSPLVREGAVYGLVAHEEGDVSAALRALAEQDPSPGVRTAARDALEAR
jgi:HEAT repeat protein